ncbi:hypothetical protein LJE86_10575 [bacterium BMS3Abin03]|nr:hypothetical protein [bacterium BMS3Abin03]
MNKFSPNIFLIFVISIIFLSVSCREDIVLPDEFAGNVNEPLELNNFNSYTFLIDAKKISVKYKKQADFSSFYTQISISITDYSSGTVRFKIKDNQSVNRFSYFGNTNEYNYKESLSGFVPYLIEIEADDFSGKLKIQLNTAY